MTYFLGTLDIVASTPTSFKVGQGGLAGIIIGNESPLTTIVSFDGTSYSKSLYPGTVDYFPVPNDSSTGNLMIKPSSLLSNASSWPSSFLQFDGVGVNERINTGTYPITLQRWLGGGSVTATVTQSNELVNTGNPSSSAIINVDEPLGTTWQFTNSGLGFVLLNNGGVLENVLTFTTGTQTVQLGFTGREVLIFGILDIAGKKINDNAGNNLVDWSAGGVFLKGNPSSINKFQYQSDGSHNDWTRSGEISGTNVTVNGAKVVTHNLLVANAAAIPDIVLVMPTQASAAWYIDTITNTQFTIHTTSVWNFTWLAIKL